METTPRSLPKQSALAGTFLTSIGIQLLTLVSGVLVARMLQPDGRGVFAAVQLWPGIIASLSWLGVNYSFAVRAARDPAEIPALIRAASALSLVSSVCFLLIGWLLLPLVLPADRPDIVQWSRWYLLVIPANLLTTYLQALDQGAGRLKPFNAVRNSLSLAYMVIVVGCWIAGVRDVGWFIAALLAANVLTLIVRMHLTGWRRLRPEFDLQRMRTFTREGAPYLAASVVNLARENIEKLILLFLLGSAQLGLYVVAITASGLHATLAKSVNTLILARSGSLSSEHAARDTARIFRVMAVVSVILSLAVAATLPLLIPMLFGSSFLGAVVPAVMLVAAQYLYSQGAIVDEGLRAQARPGVGVIAGIAAVATFSILGLLLAPGWSLVGVAAAAISSQFVYSLVLAVHLRRAFQVQLFPSSADFLFIRNSLSALVDRTLRGVTPA